MISELQKIYDVFIKSGKVSTDTRKIEPNSVFFALKGESFNGNTFAPKALEAGAALVVVDEKSAVLNEKCVLVPNVLEALQNLATMHRQKLGIPVIAITGSNGKTTTKELLRDVLSQKFKTIATIGNLNNHIGVPLTLLSIPFGTEMAVIEMGANHQKEIELLCNIAMPDYGLITNIGKAHLEGFGGVEGVIKGKGEMIDHLAKHKGLAFINMDHEVLQIQAKKLNRVYAYGTSATNDMIGKLLQELPSVHFEWKTAQMTQASLVQSQLPGTFNFENMLAAAAIGAYFQIEPEKISNAISAYLPSNMRSQKIEKNTNSILLDAYNANPTSMTAAIKSFAADDTKNKVLILGDMMELGADTSVEHKNILELITSLKFEKIFLVGNYFNEHKSSSKGLHFLNTDDLINFLSAQAIQNSHILIKGSRKMALERVLEIL